ncbi:MAG: ethylbenzene dehydrogenase-related protein [Gammaproteobacteria bacterium]
MKFIRIAADDKALASVEFDGWQQAPVRTFPLSPTPLNGNPLIKKVSPFLEKSTDHGTVSSLDVAGAHNGSILAVRLSWASDKHDRMADLDQFVDGAAVMFPLAENASAFTMGAPGIPVNAWYWKANLDNVAFDVIAEGYGTSGRSRDHQRPIHCDARHDGKYWHVVFSRVQAGASERAIFEPGSPTRVAFAIWDGGNRERAGRKSFSGDFVPADIEA